MNLILLGGGVGQGLEQNRKLTNILEQFLSFEIIINFAIFLKTQI